jgi:hypothetical protein
MTSRRIKQLADYFYSSNTADDVPFRICLTSGMAGEDLTKEGFIELMTLLSQSINIKEDALKFWHGCVSNG